MGNTALSREDGPICNKSGELTFLQFFSDKFLIFCKKNRFFYLFFVETSVEKRFFYTDGEKIKKDFFQFRCVDGPSVCGKSYCESGDYGSLANLTGSTLQNFLAAVTDRDKTAFARTLCPETIMVYLLFKLTI